MLEHRLLIKAAEEIQRRFSLDLTCTVSYFFVTLRRHIMLASLDEP